MDTLEVYAANIQVSQIARRLNCHPTNTMAIEQERQSFLNWMKKVGITFTSQLDAWNHYDGNDLAFVYELDSDEFLNEYDIHPYEERRLSDVEIQAWLNGEGEGYWLRDIERILEEQTRPANYEQRSGHGLPSQM